MATFVVDGGLGIVTNRLKGAGTEPLNVGWGTGAGTVTNAGLWDAASGGNLFLKGDFTGIGLASGDSILFTIKATFDN